MLRDRSHLRHISGEGERGKGWSGSSANKGNADRVSSPSSCCTEQPLRGDVKTFQVGKFTGALFCDSWNAERFGGTCSIMFSPIIFLLSMNKLL